MTRYIICKPRGGMIDIFSLILMSLKYSERFNRILIIDTSKSLHFKDGFFKYFSSNHNNIYKGNCNEFYDSVNITTYKLRHYIDYKNFDPFTDKNYIICSGSKNNLDLNLDYNEDIILYGNNNFKLDRDIIYFFQNFVIKPIILNVLKKRFDSLPIGYVSVHIRNTDYKSNVPLFIKKHYDILKNENIFLATDDVESLKLFQKHFNNVYTFTNIIKSSNKLYGRKSGGIHFIIRKKKKHEIFNIDTVVDFLLLANSKNYYFSCKKSGFSNCAKILFDNKKIVKMENLILYKSPLKENERI